jgi:hypothetical protein
MELKMLAEIVEDYFKRPTIILNIDDPMYIEAEDSLVNNDR